MPKRVLIANRGEIVLRVARTCSKLGFDLCGIYSEADANSLHIKYCKQAINIGGRLPLESYLRIDTVIDAAKKLGCELVHPGYGFLAENREFAERCTKEGLVFVGPTSAALAISGDKARARDVASEVAPVLPGKEIATEEQALDFAESIGYPVIVKAVRGGGGRGLRIVRSSSGLSQAFASSRSESMMNFGSDRVYIEKYLDNPRHIEVQILGDEYGTIQLGERECSIQRRHQKLIEETPSPALSPELRKVMTECAINIANKMKYTSAGTVEFLYKDGGFYFMELNSRIQVEHPITEMVTGIDIVEQQMRVASGERLGLLQQDVRSDGHAIECRINCEHPVSFTPFPGTVTTFSPPTGAGIRVDSALYAGYSVPPYYDSLVAKLVCHGCDRSTAIKRMKRALSSFRVSGIPTTIPFHISALQDERFLLGEYDTSFVDCLRPYSSKEGEMAAAVFYLVPKSHHFLKSESSTDAWAKSRFDDMDQRSDYLHLGWSG